MQTDGKAPLPLPQPAPPDMNVIPSVYEAPLIFSGENFDINTTTTAVCISITTVNPKALWNGSSQKYFYDSYEDFFVLQTTLERT